MIKHRVGAAVTSELIRMRAAVVDRSFHPVLSLVEDAPKSLLRAARGYRKTRHDLAEPSLAVGPQSRKDGRSDRSSRQVEQQREEQHGKQGRHGKCGRKGSSKPPHLGAGAGAAKEKPSSGRKREKPRNLGGGFWSGTLCMPLAL